MPIERLFRDIRRRESSPEPRRYRSSQGFNLNPVWVIIGINFLLFIVTSISSDVLYDLGLIPAYFRERPWTILTNMFVHAGFWHILGNMITLYFFGSFLARLVGWGRFLMVYFLGGILGGIFFIFFSFLGDILSIGFLGKPLSIAVGASGAIYALAGTLVMLTPNLRVLLYFIVPMPLWVVVLVFMVLWSLWPGVAWQAHLGGLLAGLVVGYFFRKGKLYYYVR